MPLQTAATPPSPQPSRRSTRQRSRFERAAAVAQVRASSVARAAREADVPRSTLRGWCARATRRPATAALDAFAESPEGLRWIHRIVLAAIVVFGVLHGAGAGTVAMFLRLAGMSTWVACSEPTVRRTQARVLEAIGAWGDGTLERLGRAMPHREITLLLDETWKRLMILVAMDADSGFLLVDKHAASRDGASWNEALRETFKLLKVRVLQVVADEARGISAYARMLLGAHRASDLFHGLHDLGGAVSALHRKRSAAEAAVAKASGDAKKESRAHRRRLDARIDVVTGCLREVSAAFHPFELHSGRAVSVEALRARLDQAISRIENAAIASELSRGVIERIEKAQRLIPSWCATLGWWQGLVERTLRGHALPEPLRVVVQEMLIPLRYLESVRARALHAADRRRVDDALGTLRARLSSAPVWTHLAPTLRAQLEGTAAWLASHFVRTSSSVEGHNGFLSLRYHHRRALPPALLKALMVVHNYVLRRPDGTTAAERFFGARHDDLFEHLVGVIAPPPRPRRRQP